MEKKERVPFLYADKEEQIAYINKALVVVYIVFYVFFSWIMLISRWFEHRTTQIVAAFIISCCIALAVDVLTYTRKKNSKYLRMVAFGGLFVISLWAGIIFSAAYLKFMTLLPLVLCVFYYDTRFTVVTSAAMMVLYQGLTIIKCFILHLIPDEGMMEEFCTSLVIILLLAILIVAEKIARRFNEDALGKVENEKEMQHGMMQEIIAVAAEVRQETNHAMTMVAKLGDSTGVVSGAMGDIYQSAQNTAESIQTQTSMTQNIQNAIDRTIQYSENMVDIAEKSKGRNMNNMNLMRQLKERSKVIAELNDNVAQIMGKLSERTTAVKGISDTIFSISSQTNLLALNASIESARAGEAGRGFAVVADEIRQLAEKTRIETENIADVLCELSENAEVAVCAVNQSAEAVREEEMLISEVSANFEEMNDGVNELTENITQVDQMLMDLSSANNQIVENITHLSATTEEVTASSMEAENLSNQNLTDASTAKERLEHILTVAEKLDRYTGK